MLLNLMRRPLTHGNGVDDALFSLVALAVLGLVFGIGWWKDRQRDGEGPDDAE